MVKGNIIQSKQQGSVDHRGNFLPNEMVNEPWCSSNVQ